MAQGSLFPSASSTQADAASLLLVPPPGWSLTPAQRIFNRLVEQVEKLREKLEREMRRLDASLKYHAEHLHPRLQRIGALRKDLIRGLAPFLDDRALSKNQRKALRLLIAEQLEMTVLDGGSIDEDDLRGIFGRVHGVPVRGRCPRRDRSGASIYKQLARVLHPDLEPDPERRERKLAFMQELTAAYRSSDLHTLLRLELAWIKDEIDNLKYDPRYEAIVVPDGPFGMRVLHDGRARAWQIDRAILAMEASVERLRGKAALKEALATIRAFRESADDIPF